MEEESGFTGWTIQVRWPSRSWPPPVPTYAAAPRRLRLESQGASHRVYFNGVQLINASETLYPTGQPGIAAAVFGGPTVKILSFEGGSIGAADTTPPLRSNGQPAGSLAGGTTQTTLSLDDR